MRTAFLSVPIAAFCGLLCSTAVVLAVPPAPPSPSPSLSDSVSLSAPPDNVAPGGFTALFNGKDLTGWKGLVADPPNRAKMSVDELAKAQAEADQRMRSAWSVKDGVLVFNGNGDNLCTAKDFQDFELYVDWKIEAKGDSGIYLRGSPQVQIWDQAVSNGVGSGGLYNNEKNPSKPLVVADKPVGEWNTFHIIMKRDHVTVYLNGRMVVDDTVLENYWDRSIPMYPTGAIELQNHGNTLDFKNIYVREIPSKGAVAYAPGSPIPPEDDPRMEWWMKARYGMFIHWGLYSVLAGECEGKEEPGMGEWIMYTQKIAPQDYEKTAAKFNPVKFNADEWVKIAKNAGMKYIVITSKHHEGFSLFDSKYSAYDVMDATPFKRDIMKELADACHREGIKICWYHSIMDWHHPDAKGDNFPKYVEVLRNQVRELLTNYGEIGVMWFDGEWIGEWTEPLGRDLYKLCRETQQSVIVNNRVGKGRDHGSQGMSGSHESAGDFGTPEQEIPATGFPGTAWESCQTMNDTWGFKTRDTNWKSTETQIRLLVETSSKGGNMLMNVGPTPEGLIPAASVERLAGVGKWLAANGESIYGTHASPFKRLAWGRCTTRDGRLYLHVFNWPADGKLVVPGLTTPVRGAWLLADASSAALPVAREGENVIVTVPSRAPDAADTVIALDIAGEPVVVISPVRAGADGTITLAASTADVDGRSAHFEEDPAKQCIGNWTRKEDKVYWTVGDVKPGLYSVEVTLAAEPRATGAEYVVRLGETTSVKSKVENTGSWTDFKTFTLGELHIEKGGGLRVSVEPESMPGYAVMNLRSVVLRPVKK